MNNAARWKEFIKWWNTDFEKRFGTEYIKTKEAQKFIIIIDSKIQEIKRGKK